MQQIIDYVNNFTVYSSPISYRFWYLSLECLKRLTHSNVTQQQYH